MNNFIRFINKNQKVIFYVILIAVFALLVIYSLNYYYTKKEEENQKNMLENKITTENGYANEVNITMDNIKDETTKELSNNTIENTMKLFVNYCNSGDSENAYNMLTEECKDALKYFDAKTFKEFYIDLRFAEPQEYSLTKWSVDNDRTLCLITFNGDLMATGGAKYSANEEYYTFVKEDGKYKINVNNYVYGENKNTRYKFDNVDVKVNDINAYTKYEEITIEITNTSDKTIAFAGYENDNSVYLTNAKGTIYSSMNSEFDEKDVVVQAGETKEVTIRFNKMYNASNKATKMVFSKVILDYQDYLNTHNRTTYSNITTIEVAYN